MYQGSIQPTLMVGNVAASVEFYEQVMGFDFHGYWDHASGSVVKSWESAEPPQYAEFLVPEGRLGIRPAQDVPQPGGIGLSLRSDNLDALHQSLQERGGAPSPPAQQPWGMRSMTLRDPDGYTWTILGD